MRTNVRDWLRLLVPDEEEKDPAFRERIDRLSIVGLRVIAVVCLSGVVYFTFVAVFLAPSVSADIFNLALPATIFSLGVLALIVSFWARARPFARLAGMMVGYGVAIVQFWNAGSLIDRPEIGAFLFSGIVTGVMLIGIATLPLKPLQVLGLGAAIAVTYRVALPWVTPQLSASRGVEMLFVVQVVVLCTGLTTVVYHQRVLAYRARRSARQALEQLRRAQARLLVSENAHSQSRLAAALSHELNTPLGALSSAFDTLLHIYKKVDLEKDERYAEILASAEQAGRGSAARLRETIERMRYLTNLDRAEEQAVDLNELCRQTAASLGRELEGKVDLDFDCDELPLIRARPVQLSAVLSNLFRNAAAAIEGRGRISVVTRHRDGVIVLEIRDNGRGIPEDQLARLFEPSFQLEGVRVSTTNWGLFVCRAIVTEHGGRLEIESKEGLGTTARVSLPVVDNA